MEKGIVDRENSAGAAWEPRELHIGWAQADITPEQPVLLAGQFHARVSEGILDPITVTVLALEDEGGGPGSRAVLVSCDLVTISDELLETVREQAGELLPELDPNQIFLNCIHTHTAPDVRYHIRPGAANVSGGIGLSFEELGVMSPADYVPWAAGRIAAAVTEAWQGREPGGISWGLGQAVVGRNRRWTTYDGVSTMYGNTNTPDFSHIEGYEDHSVNILFTWDKRQNLTGMVVNLACPAQDVEGLFSLSADYWHDARQEIRRRWGEKLFVLPQISPAGDQSPHLLFRKEAEMRMMKLKGRSHRQDIGMRIAGAVADVLPWVRDQIDWQPGMRHISEHVRLPRRLLTEADVQEALAEAASWRSRYEEAIQKLADNPDARQEPHWYVEATKAYNRAEWFERVEERFRLQQEEPEIAVPVHVIRLGDIALATNPFEYYLDYAIHIHARSKAIQNFLVQLTGSGTYLPTERAVSGRSYGAIPASTSVGPEGGRLLASRTVEMINSLWEDDPA